MYASVSIGVAGVYTLYAKAKTSCGTSPAPTFVYNFVVTRGGSGNSFFFPNPVSDVLTVDLDEYAASRDPSLSAQAVPTYDVRLYDTMGKLVIQQSAQSGTLQFNVSKLPNGIYFLRIYDGANAPESFQVIVHH
jgi:hypothetical protein